MQWRTTLLISGLAVLAVFLDTTVLFVAFPSIVASFPEVQPTALSWVLNAYTIVYAALIVPAGKLSDRLGHKRTFMIGSLLFTAASLACGLAPTAGSLIAFRALQAVGAALLIPASLALIIRATPPEHLTFAVAIWGAIGAVSGAVGPSLGAGLIMAIGWRGVFFINLPIGVLTWFSARARLSESSRDDARLPHWPSVVLVAGGAALMSLGFVQSEAWGWSDVRTIGALSAGALLVVAFVIVQRQSSSPVLDLHLFRNRDFVWANIASVAFGVTFTSMFLGSILFLTEVWKWSTLAAGLAVAPGPALVAVVAPRLGRLAHRTGQRPLVVLGGIIYGFAGLLRWVMLDGEPDYLVDYLPSMLLSGLGVAMCLPQLSSSVAQSLPANRLGVGTATNQAIRQFAGTFGVALTIAFISSADSTEAAVAAFDRVWMILLAGGLLTGLLSLPMSGKRSSP